MRINNANAHATDTEVFGEAADDVDVVVEEVRQLSIFLALFIHKFMPHFSHRHKALFPKQGKAINLIANYMDFFLISPFETRLKRLLIV